MPSSNRSTAASFYVELCREQDYNATDLLSYVQLNILELTSQNGIALALELSGITAALLTGGRTAHSALKSPLSMQFIETPTCDISKTSDIGKVLQNANLLFGMNLLWCPKKSIEALDQSLQDLRGNIRPFRNALILLAEDFSRTLPIIPRSPPRMK
ncbi:unnamed protein product [Onchocerca ochengi]|uniref:ATP-dependent DNA helicase n=1 Tax=Onchocerca ochengi TaxID=42157 RepID=A0A182E341_ONCOC|nr:unnamed protein product [Onchocerca ochengi]